MQTKKLNLADLQQQLSRVEMKQIKAGEDFGCGTSISCDGKASGDACGTKSCICEVHSGGLWCTSQLASLM
ncbi:hypothetical protein [Hydrotalea sp.]|uniref:hypothetical protein n=1 Tax=Hydrotalea sp. TaxID=2881279 RepID=UPI002586F69B|nr:hypothetical protein [Hydrotalea sp.]